MGCVREPPGASEPDDRVCGGDHGVAHRFCSHLERVSRRWIRRRARSLPSLP